MINLIGMKDKKITILINYIKIILNYVKRRIIKHFNNK
jgi:hypothetical protein